MKIASFWGNGTAVSEKCTKCGLHNKCESPFTKVYGEGKTKTLLVLDKPSEQEDRGRSPYGGVTMAKLSEGFADVGIDIKTAFWKCNAIQCYTKKVSDSDPEACRENLIKVINRDLKDTLRKYNIPYNIKSHSFRVNIITNLLKVTSVQNTANIIGHNDIRSTMIYNRYALSKFFWKEFICFKNSPSHLDQ